MKLRYTFVGILLMGLLGTASLKAQESQSYVWPKDTLVARKLAWWRNLKFGLLMHWGTYSQWGIVESWSICPEDEGWTQRHGHGSENYFTYKQNYENLIRSFNPIRFNPDKWAAAAKAAGMKYVIFTTKHHDGFCMFDTHQTGYKITSRDCPFHSNPRANITKAVFQAFRKKGLGIGAYFSKPDWHSPYYWWPYFPPLDRYPNYNETKYPQRWQQFKDFTYNQIQELLNGTYGKVDILWLDGGWVRPHRAATLQRHPRENDDVDMPRIAAMARREQPGILLVDRDVPGPYQNYLTPEQQVPDHPLPYPWETCMTMGTSWSYKFHDRYKSSRTLINLLLRIVSRGGNFLLNIGPDAQGDWDPVAYERLRDIGTWMKLNSEGIYGSRPLAPYQAGKLVYTQSKDGRSGYGFYLADSAETRLPARVLLPGVQARSGSRLYLLGYARPLRYRNRAGGIQVQVPANLQAHPPCSYAWTFKFRM